MLPMVSPLASCSIACPLTPRKRQERAAMARVDKCASGPRIGSAGHYVALRRRFRV